MKKNKINEAEKARMFKVIDMMSSMCEDCRLYAVKFYIWNVDSHENLEEVATLALETIPGKMGTEDYFRSIRRVLNRLPPTMLKDLTKVALDLAVYKCPKDICSNTCRDYGHWK